MMFQILSDIHIEKRPGGYTHPSAFIKPSARYLILLGDIGSFYDTSNYVRFITDLTEMYTKVFVIFGNNEYYTRGRMLKPMAELRQIIRMIFHLNRKVRILDNEFVMLDSVMIYGSVLWSKLPEDLENFKYWIRYEKRKNITVAQYNQLYTNAVKGLIKAIRIAKGTGKQLIVATHFPPTEKGTVTGKKFGSRGKYLYINNLDKLLKRDLIHTWVFGHTHINVDMLSEGGTRLVTNQYGSKVVPEAGFDREKIICCFPTTWGRVLTSEPSVVAESKEPDFKSSSEELVVKE